MRVSCTRSTTGSTYRIYRSNDEFVAHMRRLVPFLRADQYDILIGGTTDEPDVVLTIGPLQGAMDSAFRQRVDQYLEE